MFSRYIRYMESIHEIVKGIGDILKEKRGEPIDMLGSRIVGVTIVSEEFEKYYAEYPPLERLAELGAELETLADSKYAEEVLGEIMEELGKLKLAIHT